MTSFTPLTCFSYSSYFLFYLTFFPSLLLFSYSLVISLSYYSSFLCLLFWYSLIFFSCSLILLPTLPLRVFFLSPPPSPPPLPPLGPWRVTGGFFSPPSRPSVKTVVSAPASSRPEDQEPTLGLIPVGVEGPRLCQSVSILR